MDKTKKLIKETILFSISAISDDIQNKILDSDELATKATAIKTLAEAYCIVNSK